MRPIATDRVAWSVSCNRSRCHLGLRIRVGRRNHVLDGGSDPVGRGKGRPVVKYTNSLPWALQKRLNRTRCRLGLGFGWAHGTMYQMGLEVAPCEGAIFRANGTSAGMTDDTLQWAEQKWLNRSRCSFWLWTRMGPRKHVFGGMHTGTTWRMLLNRPCAAAMWSFCKITLTIKAVIRRRGLEICNGKPFYIAQ